MARFDDGKNKYVCYARFSGNERDIANYQVTGKQPCSGSDTSQPSEIESQAAAGPTFLSVVLVAALVG